MQLIEERAVLQRWYPLFVENLGLKMPPVALFHKDPKYQENQVEEYLLWNITMKNASYVWLLFLGYKKFVRLNVFIYLLNFQRSSENHHLEKVALVQPMLLLALRVAPMKIVSWTSKGYLKLWNRS